MGRSTALVGYYGVSDEPARYRQHFATLGRYRGRGPRRSVGGDGGIRQLLSSLATWKPPGGDERCVDGGVPKTYRSGGANVRFLLFGRRPRVGSRARGCPGRTLK